MQQIFWQPSTIVPLPTINFPNRKFLIKQLLGQGGEGQIYSARTQNWGEFVQDVAIKVDNKLSQDEYQLIQKVIKYQENENNLAIEKKSQIIKIYEITDYNDKAITIMELGQQNLFDYMTTMKGQLTILQKIQILKQLTQSLIFLHSNNVIHRDIKPENFIKVGDEFKLIDFGQTKSNFFLQKTKNVGTKQFQAPEIQNGSSTYSFQIDIWSLGGTFYELLCEEEFQGTSVGILIKSSQSIPFQVKTNLSTLLNKMLQQEAFKRENAENIFKELVSIEKQLQISNKQNFFQITQNPAIQPFNSIQTHQNFKPFFITNQIKDRDQDLNGQNQKPTQKIDNQHQMIESMQLKITQLDENVSQIYTKMSELGKNYEEQSKKQSQQMEMILQQLKYIKTTNLVQCNKIIEISESFSNFIENDSEENEKNIQFPNNISLQNQFIGKQKEILFQNDNVSLESNGSRNDGQQIQKKIDDQNEIIHNNQSYKITEQDKQLTKQNSSDYQNKSKVEKKYFKKQGKNEKNIDQQAKQEIILVPDFIQSKQNRNKKQKTT